MPVIFSKRTGRPCCEDAIEIANGEFIFFIFGGGVEIVPVKIFFSSRGCELFFFIFPISDFHSITIAGPLCVPVDDSSGLFFLSADEPLT